MNMGVRCGRCTYLERVEHRCRKDYDACFCKHPEAEVAFRLFHPDNEDVCRLSSVKKGQKIDPMMPTPRWCPQRLLYTPTKITREEAYKIIDTRRPLGLFFCVDDGRYVAVANEGGDAFVEDFPDKAKCIHYLKNQEAGGNDCA